MEVVTVIPERMLTIIDSNGNIYNRMSHDNWATIKYTEDDYITDPLVLEKAYQAFHTKQNSEMMKLYRRL